MANFRVSSLWGGKGDLIRGDFSSQSDIQRHQVHQHIQMFRHVTIYNRGNITGGYGRVHGYVKAPYEVMFNRKGMVVHEQEKEQLKSLNNDFISFIDKVRVLEQENTKLEKKWSLLKEQTHITYSDADAYKEYIAKLHRQLDGLSNQKMKLEANLRNKEVQVKHFKTMYESQVKTHATAEEKFVVLKKKCDDAHKRKTGFEAKAVALEDEINFLRKIYAAQEQHKQQIHTKHISVVLAMDNQRKLQMDAIVAEVCAQYEDVTKLTCFEAKAKYNKKYEEMVISFDRLKEELRKSKSEVHEVNKKIASIQKEIEDVKRQRTKIETSITEAKLNKEAEETKVKEEKKKIELEMKSDQTKIDDLVINFQELMNIKMALNIEIAAYMKLLEGEEHRFMIEAEEHLGGFSHFGGFRGANKNVPIKF